MDAIILNAKYAQAFTSFLTRDLVEDLYVKKKPMIAIGILEGRTPVAVAICELYEADLQLLYWYVDSGTTKSLAFETAIQYMGQIGNRFHRSLYGQFFSPYEINQIDQSYEGKTYQQEDFYIGKTDMNLYRFKLGQLQKFASKSSGEKSSENGVQKVSLSELKKLINHKQQDSAWDYLPDVSKLKAIDLDVSCCYMNQTGITSLLLLSNAGDELEVSFLCFEEKEPDKLASLLGFCVKNAFIKYSADKVISTVCIDDRTSNLVEGMVKEFITKEYCYQAYKPILSNEMEVL